MTGCMDGQGGFCPEQNHTAKPNFMLSIYHFDDSGPDRIVLIKYIIKTSCGPCNTWLNGVEHTHAFILCPEAWHFCEVKQHLSMTPVVHSGIRDIKVLKTTQSGFEGFLRDRFTTLTDAKDRFFCTSVYDTIIQKFAGPYDRGEYSPSVQKTLYDTQVLVEEIEIIMPNQHYFITDMTKMGLSNKDEVYLPLDNPSGNITGTIRRKPRAKM
uniref:Uricase n=1 Tax=Sinocyclocheilus grahami TaxID=75366 RepID=A0A672SG79_SINGR